MAIESLGGVTAQASTNLATALVSQEDFIRILLTQLTFQDPLKPLDNQEFIAQLAQFTNLEQTRQLTDRTDTLLAIQAATQSIGLIGKTVDVDTAAGPQTGQVTTVTFQAGEPRVTVRTTAGAFLTDVSLGRITLVR